MDDDQAVDRDVEDADEIAPENHFEDSKARPNRFASQCPPGGRLVLLDPDIAASFPDAQAVNTALRASIGNATSSGS